MTTVEVADPLAGIADREQVFIGGRWVDSTGDDWIEVVDSWSERTAARVRAATAEDVARAVDAARESFDRGDWAHTPIAERADVIDALADALEARLEELTTLGIVEVGVPVPVSMMTQQMVIGLFRAVAQEALKVTLVDERTRADGGVSRVVKEPNGVVAVIIPWNGPIGTIAFKVIPALAEDTVVAIDGKTSRRTANKKAPDTCTGSDCLDTVLQLRRPFALHKPDGLRGVT